MTTPNPFGAKPRPPQLESSFPRKPMAQKPKNQPLHWAWIVVPGAVFGIGLLIMMAAMGNNEAATPNTTGNAYSPQSSSYTPPPPPVLSSPAYRPADDFSTMTPPANDYAPEASATIPAVDYSPPLSVAASKQTAEDVKKKDGKGKKKHKKHKKRKKK